MNLYLSKRSMQFSGILALATVVIFVGEQKLYYRNTTPEPLPKIHIANGKHFHANNTSSLLIHTEKMLSPAKIKIETVGDMAKTSGDVFTLRVSVISHVALNEVNLFWDIPPGVEMIQGSLSQVIRNLNANESQSIQAVFRQLTDQNEQIHLSARAEENQRPFASQAQYNTLDQTDIDRSIAALKQRTEDYIREQKAK